MVYHLRTGNNAVEGKARQTDMNKALHAFVYLFVILTGAAIFFEYGLHEKRMEMKDRNRLQEDFIIDVARITETGDDDNMDSKRQKEVDVSPVEAKIVDSPDMEDVLAVKGYDFYLEKIDHKYFNWAQAEREKLRSVYVLDSEGKPVMDGAEKQVRDSEEDKLLKQLKKALETQKDRLAKTREAITALREQLEKYIDELNALKGEARKDKATIVERDESIAKLEAEKKELTEKIAGLNQQIKELNADITSLKDELQVANDEKEAVKEELEKEKKVTAQLKKLVQDLQNSLRGGGGSGEGKVASASISFGDKGKVVYADNQLMFAVVELSPETMKELKGEDLSRPMPREELNVRRAGFAGPAGEIVGRVRLRTEVGDGKNRVVVDILDNWKQAPLKTGDVLFAD